MSEYVESHNVVISLCYQRSGTLDRQSERTLLLLGLRRKEMAATSIVRSPHGGYQLQALQPRHGHMALRATTPRCGVGAKKEHLSHAQAVVW
jgi:hypothetical protein